MGKKNKSEKALATQERAENSKAAIATDFKLIIPRAVMDKINWWMHKTNKEVSGFGSLHFDDTTSTFTVKDAILLKQEVTGASAEIDPNAMAKAMFRMKDDPLGLKWHWHSHVNMGVFWSADDMEIIRSLGQRSWVLATVFNYKEEHLTAYLTQTKVQAPNGERDHDIFVNNIDTKIINYVPQNTYEAWDKEYVEHVTEYKYKHTPYVPPTGKSALDDDYEWPRTGLKYVSTYSDYGYGTAHGFPGGQKQIYNPIHDKELKTDQEKMMEIESMSNEEIEYLSEASPMFKELVMQYYEFMAKELDNVTKLPPGKDDPEEVDETQYGGT